MAGSETIDWKLAEDTQPDEGIMVLVHAPDAPEPVWPGYLDSERWYWVDGSPVCFDVIEWAEMPIGSSVEDAEPETSCNCSAPQMLKLTRYVDNMHVLVSKTDIACIKAAERCTAGRQ